MVPFMKTSAEIQIEKAKAVASDLEMLQHFHMPANDDKYNAAYYGAPETKVSND
jgi:hypothetical protein